MLRVVTDAPAREDSPSMLDEIARQGARRILAAALDAEIDAYIEAHADERDEQGRRLVVRNARAEPRSITTGAGPIEIEAPRVNDRRVDEKSGERVRFGRSIVRPWCRKSPPALKEFFGSAAGTRPAWTTCTRDLHGERVRQQINSLNLVERWFLPSRSGRPRPANGLAAR
jgi:putative transposase